MDFGYTATLQIKVLLAYPPPSYPPKRKLLTSYVKKHTQLSSVLHFWSFYIQWCFTPISTHIGCIQNFNEQLRVKPEWMWGVLISARWKGEEDPSTWGMSACSIFGPSDHWTASAHFSQLPHIFAIHTHGDILLSCYMPLHIALQDTVVLSNSFIELDTTHTYFWMKEQQCTCHWWILRDFWL